MSVRFTRPRWPTLVAAALCAVIGVSLTVGHLRERRRLHARAVADTRALAEQLASEFDRQVGEVAQALRAVDLSGDVAAQLSALDLGSALVVGVLAVDPEGRTVGGADPALLRAAPPARGGVSLGELLDAPGAPFLVLSVRVPAKDGARPWTLAARLEPDRLSDARLPPMPPFGNWAAVHDRSGRVIWRLPRLAMTFAQRLPAEGAPLPDGRALRTTAGLDAKLRYESFVPVGESGFVAVAGWRDDATLGDEDLRARAAVFSGAAFFCVLFAVAATRLRARQRA